MAFSVTVLVPVLLAGRPCNDDLARSVVGSYGWIDNGRYLSNILMRALELGAPRAIDIAPIPQLLAVLALSYAGVLLARRFEIASIPLAILVTLPLGTQPFFLQNLSYRFDSGMMVAALLCSVAAIALSNLHWRSWLWATALLLASFNLYQPAFNIFPVLAIFELAFQIARGCPGRDVARTAGIRLSQALIAAIVYKLLFTSGVKDWVADHGETIHSLAALPLAGSHVVEFLHYLHDALGSRLAAIFFALTLLAALPMIVLGIRRAWREQAIADATLRSVFLLLWPALALLASLGPMLLLVDPVFAPRVFPAIGALISAALISAACAGQRVVRLRPVAYVAGGTCLVVSAVVAGAYSSAAAEQARFEDRIASTMQDDLAQLKASAHLSRYVLIGTAGYAPGVQHAISQQPLIGELIESYLTQDSFFTESFLRHFEQPLTLVASDRLAEPQRSEVFDLCAVAFVQARSVYRIRVVDDLAVVDFRNPTDCRRHPDAAAAAH